MNPATSVYLDFVRVATAVVVLLVHARHERFTSGWLMGFRSFGNDAVMVFFVLSGFVIAYCASHKEKTLGDYTVSRLSRLYSVVLPALIATFILDRAGAAIAPDFYQGDWHQPDQPALRFFANLFFLNQVWFLSISPFSNNPFWSICYEFWYYVLFACVIYTRGRTRILSTLLAAAIAGPKILLLLPVWLLGALAYRVCARATLPRHLGLPLFLGSIALYIAFRLFEGPRILNWYAFKLVGPFVYEQLLGISKEFLPSYITGSLVAANFIGFDAMTRGKMFGAAASKLITWAASYTFTLYLLHYPLLNFWAAVTGNDPQRWLDQAWLFALVLLCVYGIGNMTEHKKHLVKKLFTSCFKGKQAKVLLR